MSMSKICVRNRKEMANIKVLRKTILKVKFMRGPRPHDSQSFERFVLKIIVCEY